MSLFDLVLHLVLTVLIPTDKFLLDIFNYSKVVSVYLYNIGYFFSGTALQSKCPKDKSRRQIMALWSQKERAKLSVLFMALGLHHHFLPQYYYSLITVNYVVF